MENQKKSTGIKGILKFIFTRILGGILMLSMLVSIISGIQNSIKWAKEKKSLEAVYAYGDNGNLYYEKKGREYEIEVLHDFNGNTIRGPILEDGLSIKVYIDENNKYEGIYIDTSNNSENSFIENPFLGFSISVFVFCLGFLLFTVGMKGERLTFYGTIAFLSTLGILAVYMMCLSVGDFISAFKIQMNDAETTATIYSEIYNPNKHSSIVRTNGRRATLTSCHALAKYEVNGQEYVYVDYYSNTPFEELDGKQIVVCYDKKDPSKAIKKGVYLKNGELLFIIIFVVIGIIVFFVVRRYKKNKGGKKK